MPCQLRCDDGGTSHDSDDRDEGDRHYNDNRDGIGEHAAMTLMTGKAATAATMICDGGTDTMTEMTVTQATSMTVMTATSHRNIRGWNMFGN